MTIFYDKEAFAIPVLDYTKDFDEYTRERYRFQLEEDKLTMVSYIIEGKEDEADDVYIPFKSYDRFDNSNEGLDVSQVPWNLEKQQEY